MAVIELDRVLTTGVKCSQPITKAPPSGAPVREAPPAPAVPCYKDRTRYGRSPRATNFNRPWGGFVRGEPDVEQSTATLEARIEQLKRELDEARTELRTRTEERDEARRQQTATADVLKVMSRSGFDLQAVFETLVDLAARLCRAERATILRLNGDCFTLGASYGMPADYKESMLANPVRLDGGSLSGRAVLDGRPVHVQDVLAHPEYTRHETQSLGGFRSALAAPLMRDGSPIGSIFLTRAAVDPFTQQQIELITTFADQAVIAIENARLFGDVQERTRELHQALEQQTATSEVLEVISSSPAELKPVFEVMLERATRICEAQFGNLFLSDGQCFRAVAMHGPAEYVNVWCREPKIELCEHPHVPLARAAETRGLVHIRDLREERAYIEGDSRMLPLVTPPARELF